MVLGAVVSRWRYAFLIMPTPRSPASKPPKKRSGGASADPAIDAVAAVDNRPEFTESLNRGEPRALLDLLEAAGGKVKGATIRVKPARRAAAGG